MAMTSDTAILIFFALLLVAVLLLAYWAYSTWREAMIEDRYFGSEFLYRCVQFPMIFVVIPPIAIWLGFSDEDMSYWLRLAAIVLVFNVSLYSAGFLHGSWKRRKTEGFIS